MKFTELKKRLQAEGVKNIYVFDGEDVYFRDKGVQQLKETFVAHPEINYTSFDGVSLKGDKIKQLADAVYALPFLSEKRMVVATGFRPTEKEYESYLKPLFEKPVESSILVFVNGEKSVANACDLKKKPNTVFVDCARADEETVTKWIYLTFKHAGVIADGNVCGTVQRYCVSDMARVSKEVEKIIEYVGVGGTVTSEIVDALVYQDSEYKLYELSQAASRKDYNRFIWIMDGMVGKGFDENAFLNALCSHFRTLYEAASFKGDNASAAKALDMKEYAVKKSREQAARFSLDALGGYYRDTYEALCAARAGEITFSAALKSVVAKIFFKTY